MNPFGLWPVLAGTLIAFSVIRADAADNAAVFQACMEKAKAISKSMTTVAQRDITLRTIAQAYARVGLFDQFENTVDAIQSTGLFKVELALDLQERIQAQNPKSSKRLLSLAIKYADALPRTESRERVLQRIAFRYAADRHIDEALKTAALIESPELRNQSRYQISEAQVGKKDIDGAIATAEPIPAGRWRDAAFRVLARAVAQTGDMSRARELAAQTQRPDAVVLEPPKTQPAPKTEDTDFSKRLDRARLISNPAERVTALINLGVEAARAGGNRDITRTAYREAHATGRESGNSWLLAYAGRSQATAELFDDAMKTAEDLGKLPYEQRASVGDDRLVRLLTEIAEAQYRAGQREAARRIVDSIEKIWFEHKNMSVAMTFVSAATNVRNFDLARRIAAEIPIERRQYGIFSASRPAAWQMIAVALAKNGDFGEAFKAADDIHQLERTDNTRWNQFERTDDTFWQIAVEQMRKGRLPDAFRTVDRISVAGKQVNALTDMAVKAKLAE